MERQSDKKYILYPNAHWYFALAVIVTWIGFSSSYFARFTRIDIYHHIHGTAAGLWLAVLIIQPILYQRGRLDLHRRLGKWASLILVPLLVFGGIKMMHMMLLNQSAYPPGIVYQLAYYDTCSILIFLLFFGLSLWYARKLQLHARYIACTVLILLPPAITRALFFIPWFNSFVKTVNGSLVIIELVLLLLILDDKRTGKFRAPYLVAAALLILLHLTINYAGDWTCWHKLMDGFAHLTF